MKRLLLAADDRTLTRFLAESLLGRRITPEEPGTADDRWDISRAHSGLEIQLITRDSGRVFDVIVIDGNLTGDPLISVLRDLRSAPETAEIPILLMSERGRDKFSRKKASEQFMVAGFIDKPVTQDSLRQALDGLDRPRQLLIVDARPERAVRAANAIGAVGFDVHVARSGSEALQWVESNVPVGVVVALDLPDMLGTDLCVSLKRSPRTQAVSVLLHGDFQRLAQIEITENAHRADEFLREPFEAAALISHLMPLVGHAVSTPASTATAPAPARKRPTRPHLVRPSAATLSPEKNKEVTESSPAVSAKPKTRPQRVEPEVPPPSASPRTDRSTQRSTRRVPCQVQVSVGSGDTIYTSETLNISNGGIMIATDHPLKVGSRMNLRFALPMHENEPIDASGIVAWIGDRTDDGKRPVGVKFKSIEPKHLDRIVEYVNRVASIVYVAP